MSHRRKTPRPSPPVADDRGPAQSTDAVPKEAPAPLSPRAPNRPVLALSVALYLACVAFLLWQALRG